MTGRPTLSRSPSASCVPAPAFSYNLHLGSVRIELGCPRLQRLSLSAGRSVPGMGPSEAKVVVGLMATPWGPAPCTRSVSSLR